MRVHTCALGLIEHCDFIFVHTLSYFFYLIGWGSPYYLKQALYIDMRGLGLYLVLFTLYAHVCDGVHVHLSSQNVKFAHPLLYFSHLIGQYCAFDSAPPDACLVRRYGGLWFLSYTVIFMCTCTCNLPNGMPNTYI